MLNLKKKEALSFTIWEPENAVKVCDHITLMGCKKGSSDECDFHEWFTVACSVCNKTTEITFNLNY